MARRCRRLVAFVALAVLTTACHSGRDTASTTTRSTGSSTSTTLSTTTSTSVAPTSSSSTLAPIPPPTGPCGADNEPLNAFQIGSSGADKTSRLTSVTVRATARCTDEVVFAFAQGSPVPVPVTISIVKPPFTLAGSGATVTVAGERFYKVQFEPASTFDFTSGRPSYTGPANIVAQGTSHVRQMVNTVAFEGVVTWIIGVGAEDQFLFTGAAVPPSLTLKF
jgi:hypothetical protein